MEKNKRMPFRENDEYVSRLLDSTTRHAIKACRAERKHASKVRTSALRFALGTAASLGLVLGIGWRVVLPHGDHEEVGHVEVEHGQGPLDVFLAGITDEEAQTIVCYDVEEISEY